MKHYNIPIFVPHRGCPNDCVFCNQKHITGIIKDITEEEIREIVDAHLETIPKEAHKEIAFFGGSFTGIDMDIQRKYLSLAYEYIKNGDVSGIRLSTRPDYINKEILDQLAEFGVKVIELGVQSMDEAVLKASNRGHGEKEVESAARQIKEYGFELGLQMMTGLPGDNEEKALKTADKIIALSPDFVRIYPTLVLKDTELERRYKAGEYTPQGLNEAVSLAARLLRKFNENKIKVIRIALMTTDEISPGGKLVAGPFHNAFRELVESKIYYEDIKSGIKDEKNIVVAVNPGEISKVIGNKKCNLEKLKGDGINITVKADKRIKKGNFKIR